MTETWEPGGWKATAYERSAGVFVVTARSADGMTIELTTTDPDAAIERLKGGDTYREPWLSTDELCEHFKVGRAWVGRMTKQGMPYVRIGKRRKFKASACEEWLRWIGAIDDERL